jgi:type VI secretion system protein ImpK
LNKTVVLKAPPAPAPVPPGRQSQLFRATRMMPRPSTHPLMGPMYWACSDLLVLASQAAQGVLSTSAPELRQRLSDLLAAMTRRGQSSGITPEDLRDASYAIMALLDEILVKANWPGRQEWQASPLQFIHFRENTAGDNFFRRIDALAEQPHRAHVLQVYFLCMALGFQGRHAMGVVAEWDVVFRRVSALLAGSTLPSEILSPHGVPPDAGRTFLQREAPIVRVALALFAVACLLFVTLRIVRSIELARAIEPMRAYAGAPLLPPKKR